MLAVAGWKAAVGDWRCVRSAGTARFALAARKEAVAGKTEMAFWIPAFAGMT